MKTTLQLILGTNAVVFDYATDFDELWRMELLADTVVVVYARTPGDDRVSPVDTAQFLSPLIWALCARSAGIVRRVVILSLADRQSATSGLHRYLDLLRSDALPWLRIAQPQDLQFNDPLRSLGLDGDLPDDTAGHDAVSTLLDVLRQRLADPSAPDDRHAISNLVWPFLLLGRQPMFVGNASATESDHISALHRVLRSCGLLKKHSTTAPEIEAQTPLPTGTRLYLLDDQWRHGWGEWVCSQVAGVSFEPPAVIADGWTRISSVTSQTAVFASADPMSVLGSLVAPGPLRLVPGARDKRFELSMDVNGNTTDILLLDLRLFAGGGQRERSWTRDVVGLCRMFEGNDHAWPGFSKGELDAIEAWADGGSAVQRQADSVATKARGLLGRLLALTDLSLPIVMFSSTADADLIDQFKDYGNVITTFHKPRTFGPSATEDRTHFVHLFRSALKQAQVVLEARAFVQRIHAWARDGHERALGLAAQAPQVVWNYAELYLDEHGTDGGPINRAGGYVALYSDSDAEPLTLSEEFARPWGVGREAPNYGGPFRKKANTVDAVKREAEYTKRAEEIRAATSVRRVGLSACVVDGNTSSHEKARFGPDAVYRAMISVAVELFLYDWLPALGTVLGQPISAGIFLGTKLQYTKDAQNLIASHWNFGMPLTAFPENKGNAAMMLASEEFRLAEFDGKVGYARTKDGVKRLAPSSMPTHQVYGRTMESADAFALVLAIARERKVSTVVKRAAAVTLTYDASGWVSPPPDLPRQVHYASDDLLHKPEAAHVALHSGFHCALSPALTSLLHASRAFDSASTLAIGLRQFREAASDLDALGDLPLWVSVRCVPLLSSMKGADFIHFAASKLPSSALLLQASRVSGRAPSGWAQPKNRNRKNLSVPPKTSSPAAQPPTQRQGDALTREDVERLLGQHVPTLAKDFVVKAIFADPAWCVLALDGRNGVSMDLPTLSKTEREAGVRAFRRNWKTVAWSDDAIALANQILGQNDGRAEHDNEEISVEAKVSDIKVRAIEELTRKAVKRRPQL